MTDTTTNETNTPDCVPSPQSTHPAAGTGPKTFRVVLHRTEYQWAAVIVHAADAEQAEELARKADPVWVVADAEEDIAEVEEEKGGQRE